MWTSLLLPLSSQAEILAPNVAVGGGVWEVAGHKAETPMSAPRGHGHSRPPANQEGGPSGHGGGDLPPPRVLDVQPPEL